MTTQHCSSVRWAKAGPVGLRAGAGDGVLIRPCFARMPKRLRRRLRGKRATGCCSAPPVCIHGALRMVSRGRRVTGYCSAAPSGHPWPESRAWAIHGPLSAAPRYPPPGRSAWLLTIKQIWSHLEATTRLSTKKAVHRSMSPRRDGVRGCRVKGTWMCAPVSRPWVSKGRLRGTAARPSRTPGALRRAGPAAKRTGRSNRVATPPDRGANARSPGCSTSPSRPSTRTEARACQAWRPCARMPR